MADFVPAQLTGVWRREVITTPQGYRDETTRVFWLQTRSWYGDLRVRADRPLKAAQGFGDYDDAELIQLAASQGFCGQLTARDGVCLWRRDFDYQPPSGEPDEAKFAIDGEVMIEDGLHSDYQEIWRRASRSLTPLAALRLTQDNGASGWGVLLVVAGDHFIEVQDRTKPLPPGKSLGDIVSTALAQGRRQDAIEALSFRICYGHIERGQWIVALSTFPWLEGRSLFAGQKVAFDARAGRLTREDAGVQTWTVIDATADSDALSFP